MSKYIISFIPGDRSFPATSQTRNKTQRKYYSTSSCFLTFFDRRDHEMQTRSILHFKEIMQLNARNNNWLYSTIITEFALDDIFQFLTKNIRLDFVSYRFSLVVEANPRSIFLAKPSWRVHRDE